MKLGPIEKIPHASARPRWGWVQDLAPGESRTVTGVSHRAVHRMRDRVNAEGRIRISVRKEGEHYRVTRLE